MVHSIMAAPSGGMEYQWESLGNIPDGTHIRAIKITDEHRNIVLRIEMPSKPQIAFARSLAHVGQIYTAATAWRQAIINTNGVAAAENTLMAALEGRALKTKAEPLPPTQHCVRCGAELDNVSPGFSATADGLVCANCLRPKEELLRARSI